MAIQQPASASASPLLSKLVCNRLSPQRMLILTSPFHPPNRKTSRQQLLPTFVDEKKDKERRLMDSTSLGFPGYSPIDWELRQSEMLASTFEIRQTTFDRRCLFKNQKQRDASNHDGSIIVSNSIFSRALTAWDFHQEEKQPEIDVSKQMSMKRPCHDCK